MEEWNTEITYKINEIIKQLDEIHNDILLREIVDFCGQKDLFEYRISVDTLKEALDFYFKHKERAKGKWITDSNYPDAVICNKCNSKYDVWWIDKGSNYCPNCGAEMEE